MFTILSIPDFHKGTIGAGGRGNRKLANRTITGSCESIVSCFFAVVAIGTLNCAGSNFRFRANLTGFGFWDVNGGVITVAARGSVKFDLLDFTLIAFLGHEIIITSLTGRT
jgi:hypothetical protein